jgi:Mce-associated membrane protein
MNASWYDVLDVEPTASAEEIRTSWRAAVAELDPTDRRFRVYNQAAEVLLDPERRAAYDDALAAELAAEAAPVEPTAESQPEPEPAAPEPAPTAATAVTDDDPHVLPDKKARALPVVPGWLLVAVAVVLALALSLAGVLVSKPSDASVAADAEAAQAAADKAVVPLLSYDAKHLDQSRAAVLPLLTSSFRSEYDKFFQGVVQQNAKGLGTVVRAQYVSSGIVRTGADQVDVLVFVDQRTTNKQHPKTPVVYKSQATLSMVKSDGAWLIDGLTTNLGGH